MNLRRILTASAVALLFLGGAPSFAQETPPVAATQEQEIVVTGQRTEEVIRAFVGEIAVAARGENQIARWDRKICPGISGMRSRYARAVIDRMAKRAFEVGLDVGEPGCQANILVLVTPKPTEVTRQMLEENKDAFGWHAQRGQRTQGRDALRAFVDSKAAVRWWHVSKTVMADGATIGEGATADAASVRVGSVSRLSRSTRLDFGSVFIVVDANQLDGLSFSGVADYLAMVALAQLDPDTDTSQYPTILNIFSAGVTDAAATTAALTDWDLAYLRGLYGAKREATSARSQQDDIARSMNRDLTRQ